MGVTRQGGCRLTDPLSCAETRAVVEKKWRKRKRRTQPLVYAAYFHLPECIETQRTCKGAGMWCQN